MNRDIDLYKPMMGKAVKEACCMRKQTRFRYAAKKRGWYFVTGEGYVGFFDTRQEAERMYQRSMHAKKLLPIKRGQKPDRKEMKLITYSI